MNMKKILEDFQNAMSAAAFAEAGEFDTAKEVLGPSKNAHKKVLLVTDGGAANQSIEHALTLCRRLEAQLEILHVRSAGASRATAPEPLNDKDNPAGLTVSYAEVERHDSLADTVAEYSRGRRDILCVVLEGAAADQPAGKRKNSSRSLGWLMKQLHCPVVVYSGSS